MGNLCWTETKTHVVDCIQQMQKVEKTLSLLINKYEKQIRDQRQQARQKLNRKNDCKRHVRTIMIIKHHKQKLEDRYTACMNKRYHLESLNVTKMHMDAVKLTGQTFSQFLKENDIQRVEELTNSLADMIDDACEINDTLAQNTGPYEADDDEIEEEYQQMQLEVQLPEPPQSWEQLDLNSSEDETRDETSKDLLIQAVR